jgi:hypothetical protein
MGLEWGGGWWGEPFVVVAVSGKDPLLERLDEEMGTL